MSAIQLLLCIACLTFTGGYRMHPGHLLNQNGNTRATLVAIATAELGVKEASGKNDGEHVERYLHAASLKRGAPWCAAFISWVHAQAKLSKPRTGWSPALFPSRYITQKTAPGNIAGIYFAHLKRIGHVGLITHSRQDWIYTIEGNTTPAGSREGDGVYRKVRHLKGIAKLADWTNEGRYVR